MYKKVRDSSLFFGFKPLDDFFSLRYANDYKALTSRQVQKLCKKDIEFKEAVDIELAGFKMNGFQTEQQDIENKVFAQSLSLDFYNKFDNKKPEIEKKIYRQMTKSVKEKISDFQTLNGNWPLINGGKNDAV